MGRSFSNGPDLPVSSRFGLQVRTPLIHAKPRRPSRASKTAPATRYPFGQSRSLKVSLIALWLCGGFVTLYVLLTRSVHALYLWFAVSSLVIGASAAYWGWARTSTGLLRWDGEEWWLEWPNLASPSPPQHVDGVVSQFDFQFFLLLRLDSAAGASRWLWLDQWSASLSDGRDWQALRRAVFSPKPSPDASDSAVIPASPALAREGQA